MRRSDRHDLRFRLLYDDGNTYSVGVVDDVSETGLLVECANPLPVGSVVRLEAIDPDEVELSERDACVVRHVSADELVRRVRVSDGGHGLVGLGLEFVDHDAAGRREIRRMIGRLEAKRSDADPLLGDV